MSRGYAACRDRLFRDGPANRVGVVEPEVPAEGCDRTFGLEVDHRIDWPDTKVTLLDWMEWMCRHTTT